MSALAAIVNCDSTISKHLLLNAQCAKSYSDTIFRMYTVSIAFSINSIMDYLHKAFRACRFMLTNAICF